MLYPKYCSGIYKLQWIENQIQESHPKVLKNAPSPSSLQIWRMIVVVDPFSTSNVLQPGKLLSWVSFQCNQQKGATAKKEENPDGENVEFREKRNPRNPLFRVPDHLCFISRYDGWGFIFLARMRITIKLVQPAQNISSPCPQRSIRFVLTRRLNVFTANCQATDFWFPLLFTEISHTVNAHLLVSKYFEVFPENAWNV